MFTKATETTETLSILLDLCVICGYPIHSFVNRSRLSCRCLYGFEPQGARGRIWEKGVVSPYAPSSPWLNLVSRQLKFGRIPANQTERFRPFPQRNRSVFHLHLPGFAFVKGCVTRNAGLVKPNLDSAKHVGQTHHPMANSYFRNAIGNH